jgi:hypothetical protein
MARSLLVAGLLSLVMMCAGSEPERGDVASDGGDGDAETEVCPNDNYEPNEAPELATLVSWDRVSSPDEEMYKDADVVIDGFLCSGEHDWYRIPIAELGFEYNVVRVDGLARGTSWCAQFESCGGETLASGPEHTLAVEIYDADSMVLLGADIATDGRVDVDGWGPNFSKDLLIHIYGPSAVATYAYELYVDVRSYDGEDECEC